MGCDCHVFPHLNPENVGTKYIGKAENFYMTKRRRISGDSIIRATHSLRSFKSLTV